MDIARGEDAREGVVVKRIVGPEGGAPGEPILEIARGLFAGDSVQRRGGTAIDEETAAQIEGEARGFLNDEIALGRGKNRAVVVEVARGDEALGRIEGQGLDRKSTRIGAREPARSEEHTSE